MRDRQVDELLVVRVLAGDRRFGRHPDLHAVAIEDAKHVGGGQAVERQPRSDLGIGQHPLQLVAHRRCGEPAQVAVLQPRAQGPRRFVREDEQVQHDVGVKDDRLACHGRTL